MPELRLAMGPEDDRDDRRSPGVFGPGRGKVMVHTRQSATQLPQRRLLVLERTFFERILCGRPRRYEGGELQFSGEFIVRYDSTLGQF